MPARKVKALTRTLEMLKVIPVSPKFCTTKEIHSHLQSLDPDITIRTVQRDLMELTSVFGLEFGDSPEGYKWSFAYDSPNQFIPALSKEEALSLLLVQEHLKLFLPSHVFERLQALFKKSEELLKKEPDTKNWNELVQTMPQALSFKPSQINQKFIDAIYEALINKNWLEIKYDKKDKTYNVQPLGVIVRDAKLVLVCQYEGFENTRNLLVHRLKHVRVTNSRFNNSFTLKSYVKKQAASVLVAQEKINLEFAARGYVKRLLLESSFDKSQKVYVIDDEWVNVTMRVSHTVELENWLQSQLHNVKIIGPAPIKERVYNKLKDALELNNLN